MTENCHNIPCDSNGKTGIQSADRREVAEYCYYLYKTLLKQEKNIALENVLHRLLVMFIKVCINKFRIQACNCHASVCFTPWVLPQLSQGKEGNNLGRKGSVRNYFLLSHREAKTPL